MAAAMKLSSKALRLLVPAIALTLTATWPGAAAAAGRTTRARPAPRKPPAPNNTVIPLPLEPVVPAGQRLCANRTPSGLGYTMLRAASGPRPAATDTALINYVGYLAATGTVFDQNMRTPLGVDQVIPGFSEGLQLLSKSGIARLCIPAAIGYGARGTGPIPANSDLVFQVELVDFKTAAEIEDMRKAQAAEAEAPPPADSPQP
jgi:FKBP-type peptidyl-prolyl cis-trans isomerase FkpA